MNVAKRFPDENFVITGYKNQEDIDNIREFSKKLRLDKEIIEEHWKKVYKDPKKFYGKCLKKS